MSDINVNNNYTDMKNLTPFKLCVLQNFPFIEADFDAVTNYQLLCKVVEYLNKVIDNSNTQNVNISQLEQNFIELYNYVKNYFDNLDVQEEINKKLDELVLDGTISKLLFNNLGYKTPEMFGAVGDGVTDDTTSMQNALDSGGVILLLEKKYKISSTIKVNINTTRLIGSSSRSVIFYTGNDIGILFYSPKTDYYTRTLREQEHGNFLIQADNGDCCKIGGDDGTEYEGAVEMQTFKHIMCNCKGKCFILNSHVYNVLFDSCDVYKSEYSLYSLNTRDTGECITFLKCGFWQGKIYLKHQSSFISSTIHLLEGAYQIIDNLKTTHYIQTDVLMIGCHFEMLTNTIRTDNIGTGIYLDGTLKIIDCEGVANDVSRLTESLIHVKNGIDGDLNAKKCIIENCNFQYLQKWGHYSNAMFVGNIVVNGLINRADKGHYFGCRLKDNSVIFRPSDLIITNNVDNLYITTNFTDGKLEVTITNNTGSFYNGRTIGIYGEIPVDSHLSIFQSGNISCDRGTALVGINNNRSYVFLDMYKNEIPLSTIYNDIVMLQSGTDITVTNYAYQIPDICKYIRVGFSIGTGQLNVGQSVTVAAELYFELA